MKKGTKTLLLVAGGLVALGVFLMAMMIMITGGNLGVYLDNSGWHYGNEQRGNGKMLTGQHEFSAITSIDVDASVQTVELRTGGSGNTVKIEYSYPVSSPKPICTGEGGQLRFISKEKEPGNNSFKIWFFNLGSIGLMNNKRDYKVTITYPESMEFDSVKLRTDVGSLTVKQLKVKGMLDAQVDLGSANLEKVTSQDLIVANSCGSITVREATAKTISIENDLGSITCEKLDADRFSSDNSNGSTTIENSRLGDAELSASLGRILADGITTTGLQVENSNGSVELTGTLAGKTEVENSLGSVKINTNIARDQYSLDVKTGLGSVYINSEKAKEAVKYVGTMPNEIVAHSDSGSIHVDFK